MSYSTNSEPLKVAVVGAGIGGLAVAAALRQQGHIVEIFEASTTNREPGLGITIPPNATKVLEALGYNRDNLRSIEWKQAVLVHPGSQPHTLYDMQYYPQAYGGYWIVCSRVALHVELKRLACLEGDGQPNFPCKIHFACPVTSCDPELASITLEDGRILYFDLIIGADGIKSCIRQSIHETSDSSRSADTLKTGFCTYRFTLEKRRVLEALPGLAWVTQKEPAGPRVLMTDDLRHVFLYLINCPERGELLSVGVIGKDKRDQSECKWRVEVPREQMLAETDGFDETWKTFFNLAPPTVGLWQLRILNPVHAWTKGKACVMGDAAHAMFQTLGQGAAQAFEDAFLLGTLFPLGTSNTDIPALLARYETVRKPRVQFVHALGVEEALTPEKRGNYMQSPKLQKPVMGYDIIGEMGRCKFSSVTVGGFPES